MCKTFDQDCVAIADAIFKSNYLEWDIYWRGSTFCYTAATMFLMSNYVSVSMLHLLAISRYSVVRNPFTTRFTENRFIHRLLMIIVLSCLIITTNLSIAYNLSSQEGYLPNGLCILIGLIVKSAVPVTINILIIVTQMTSVWTLPAIYLKLYITLHKHEQDMEKSKGHKEASKDQSVGKASFVSMTNIIGWLPAAILLILTMVWENYPYRILLWSTTLVLPINGILNPCIFIYGNISRMLCCSHCSKASSKDAQNPQPLRPIA